MRLFIHSIMPALVLCFSGTAWADFERHHRNDKVFALWDHPNHAWEGGGGGFGVASNTLFYGGDIDGRAALQSERSNYRGSSFTYDNFIVPDAGWRVSAVFANLLFNYTSQGADFEIRSGISVGNGGTLLFSGTALQSTQTATGRTWNGWTEYTLKIGALDLQLAGGQYWLGVRAVTFGCGGGWYLSRAGTASGANGIGHPLGDGNSFFNGYSRNFVASSTILGQGTWDFSIGLDGSPVPEPATIVSIGAGLFLLARRRTRDLSRQ